MKPFNSPKMPENPTKKMFENPTNSINFKLNLTAEQNEITFKLL